MTGLVGSSNDPRIALRERLVEAREYARAAQSEATRRAYASDFAQFSAFCEAHGGQALPADPAFVAAFLAEQARRRLRATTIERRLAAIAAIHKAGGYETPTSAEVVQAVLNGIRRELSHQERAAKSPATSDIVIGLVAPIDTRTPLGLRDRALLLLGFAGAFRRSELVALDVRDLDETPEGLRVRIRRSKTDQQGVGETIAVLAGKVLCPVKATKAWLTAAGITDGPVFRTIRRGGHVTANRLADHAVARIIKARAAAVGLDPSAFAGHSLRSGFLTSAARNGASVFKLREVSRHKSLATLGLYVRDAELFTDHAGAGLL